MWAGPLNVPEQGATPGGNPDSQPDDEEYPNCPWPDREQSCREHRGCHARALFPPSLYGTEPVKTNIGTYDIDIISGEPWSVTFSYMRISTE